MFSKVFCALLSVLCLHFPYHTAIALNLPVDNPLAIDTDNLATKRSTNATLCNYDDGFLVFRDYGPLGTPEDGEVLSRLLSIVIEANQIVDGTDHGSPNIAIHIPDTNVFFQTESTTAPGFEAMNTKLALAALYGLTTLVGRTRPRTMKIDVHDGYLGYGPWIIETVTKPRVRNITEA